MHGRPPNQRGRRISNLINSGQLLRPLFKANDSELQISAVESTVHQNR